MFERRSLRFESSGEARVVDIKGRTQVAARVMERHGVPTNDLHALSATFGAEMSAAGLVRSSFASKIVQPLVVVTRESSLMVPAASPVIS
jgi:hypothetical protein